LNTCKSAQLQEDLLRHLQGAFADRTADLEAFFQGGPWSQWRLGPADTKLENQFRLELGTKALDAIAARMDRNEATAASNMTRKLLRDVAVELMMWEVYQGLREEDAAVELSGETFKAHAGFMQEQLAESLEATHRR
jgi:hypothetical protein